MKMDAWWITIGGVEGRHIWRPSREYVRFLGFPVIAQVGANAIHGVHGPNLTLSKYHDVASYTFDVPYWRSSPPNYRHSQGSWHIDEISFSSNGLIIHEIEWDKGGHWIIECNDIEYRWLDSSR